MPNFLLSAEGSLGEVIMPAPRLYHGMMRSAIEFFTGLAIAVTFKVFSMVIVDPQLSMLLNLFFWLLLVVSVIGLFIRMEYWNIEYTYGFVLMGVIIAYAFRSFIAPLDILVYLGATLYLYRKLKNKFMRSL